MNGDGKDEIVVSNHAGVYCIGDDNRKTAVLWKYAADGAGPVVVADIDSDGFVEVVTATQYGKILVLDK
jgi:outer membrane protein assembly factor BamB